MRFKSEAQRNHFLESSFVQENKIEGWQFARIQLQWGEGELESIALDAGTRLVLTSHSNGQVIIWSMDSGRFMGSFDVGLGVRCLSFSGNGRCALAGGSDGILTQLDLVAGKSFRLSALHDDRILSCALSADGSVAISGSRDRSIGIWEMNQGRCLRELNGHDAAVLSVALNASIARAVSGSSDSTVRVWDLLTGQCVRVLEGHRAPILSLAWRTGSRYILSGSADNTIKLWDVEAGKCLRTLTGHNGGVTSLAWGPGLSALSGSEDGTVRSWRLLPFSKGELIFARSEVVQAVAWGLKENQSISADLSGAITVCDLTEVGDESNLGESHQPWQPVQVRVDQVEEVQYTNAKVLIVGDTNAGKTGLAYRLAINAWKPSEDSTVGAWSTQWELKDDKISSDVNREIWLWDFGGQADQRLIHQLYMDQSALILLVFNADQEDVLPGLRDWQTALRRCIKEPVVKFLVAGRIDSGFKASRGKLQAFAQAQEFEYHETSSKTGEGCDQLRTALIAAIPWDHLEKRTSPRIFKRLKEAILDLRDQGQVLHTFKELRSLLRKTLNSESEFSDDVLRAVLGLLDGPGIVKELDYGTYVLLAPEWINAYAQAVIRTLRNAENELGILPLRSVAEGRLIYQSVGRDGQSIEMKRLPPPEERVVLGEMERQLMERGLCLRQGNHLVFPSHCGRDRPVVLRHPSVFVSYKIKGYIEDIYATLVVRLAGSEAFKLKELWRDAADFFTLDGDSQMGLKLNRESGNEGEISVYFGRGVAPGEQVIFANYIHLHLSERCEEAIRLRHYVCPNCHTPKGNAQVLMEKLVARKQYADTECDKCESRFLLWDPLEKKFASDEVRKKVEDLQAIDALRLDSRRKGKLLALEVASRIASANQKSIDIPATEDEGIDMELEFTDRHGKGTAKRLYLQLKSGNSHLERRKSGIEIFAIKEQRWVDYWLKQQDPVMLVIGTFQEKDDRAAGREKLEFDTVRWMEISSILRRESQDGTKPVRQIEFRGEKLDLSSILRWRDKILGSP